MAALVPADARDAIEIWLEHHDRAAPGLVEGLYLVGSLALDDWRPGSDVDIVAFTADPATDDAAAVFEGAHRAAASALAERGIGTTIDGPRLAWGDVSVPPLAALRPWTLDGAFHFDGECFEINPVTWATLDRHGIAVRGGPPAELDVYVDDGELREWVRDNVATYWRAVADEVGAAIDDPTRDAFSGAMVEWCVLGSCRMAVTFATGEIASKSGAGLWALDVHPDHAVAVRAALDLRRDADPDATVGRSTVVDALALMRELIRTTVG